MNLCVAKKPARKRGEIEGVNCHPKRSLANPIAWLPCRSDCNGNPIDNSPFKEIVHFSRSYFPVLFFFFFFFLLIIIIIWIKFELKLHSKMLVSIYVLFIKIINLAVEIGSNGGHKTELLLSDFFFYFI